MLKCLSPFTRHGSVSCRWPIHRPPELSLPPLQSGEEKRFYSLRAKLCIKDRNYMHSLIMKFTKSYVNFWVRLFERHSLSVDDNARLYLLTAPKFTTNYQSPMLGPY